MSGDTKTDRTGSNTENGIYAVLVDYSIIVGYLTSQGNNWQSEILGFSGNPDRYFATSRLTINSALSRENEVRILKVFNKATGLNDNIYARY